jgi:penicillin-binding protein 1B
MNSLRTRPLNLNTPNTVEWRLIDTRNGLLADTHCDHAQWMPFIKGSAPTDTASCAHLNPARNVTNWFKELFN